MVKVKNVMVKKDRFYSILSFILSLGFWIPLLNVGFCLVSVILAFKSLRFITSDPKRYGGLGYAIAALIISMTSLIGTIVFVLIYTYRKITCEVVIG